MIARIGWGWEGCGGCGGEQGRNSILIVIILVIMMSTVAIMIVQSSGSIFVIMIHTMISQLWVTFVITKLK